MLKFDFGLPVKIYKDAKRYSDKLSRSCTTSVKESTTGLKNELRDQVRAAGMGTRLANTWRGQSYPKSGYSKDASGSVYSKAPHIVSAFDKGGVIKSRGGWYLAIPTDDAPKGFRGQRLTPGEVERDRGIRLYHVFINGTSFLVAKDVRASYSRSTGKFRGYKKASESWRRRGRAVDTVVMFILVPQVSLKKTLNVKAAAKNWHARLIFLIKRRMGDAS